eukprot:PLAT2272.1.p1 GENE.PLAT2272.1~~PLAT2272.1.p1  ORF type:complete len:234 (-),score=90.81 PLAT2272.1:187-888(-)
MDDKTAIPVRPPPELLRGLSSHSAFVMGVVSYTHPGGPSSEQIAKLLADLNAATKSGALTVEKKAELKERVLAGDFESVREEVDAAAAVIEAARSAGVPYPADEPAEEGDGAAAAAAPAAAAAGGAAGGAAVPGVPMLIRSPSLQAEFSCPLCELAVMVDPVSTECGHSFCQLCLKTALDDSRACPLCLKEIAAGASLAVNLSLRRTIQRLYPVEERMARLERDAGGGGGGSA